MPRILRTVVPRIKSSLRERGVTLSLCRSVLLPVHLVREYKEAGDLRKLKTMSEFDQAHGVETEGEYGGWTYLSDLNIASPNWFDGRNYAAIEPERFYRALASQEMNWEGYTFIDFGSGKGRALLLASELPFKRILGLEFSPELHQIAERNIAAYHSESKRCNDIRSLNLDFSDFDLPNEPLAMFFFDPCRGATLQNLMKRIGESLRVNPHPVYAVYVAPNDEVERLFQSCGFHPEPFHDSEWNFVVYMRPV